MPYFVIEDFESGLDTRRSTYNAPAGSLQVLKNAHITRGKEIERRKAFDVIGPLALQEGDDFALGLHARGDQLVVFGSGARPTSLPTTVQFETLPEVTADAVDYPVTRIRAAQNFAGKTYVVAEYGGGQIRHLYDGQVVSDWISLATNVADNLTVAQRLSTLLREQWDAEWEVTQVGRDVFLQAREPGPAISINLTNTKPGDTTWQDSTLQAGVFPSPETRATCSFEITGGSPGQTFNTISNIRLDQTDLIGSPVDFVTDNVTTAQAVADRINNFAVGYDASASGNEVTIQVPAGLGIEGNGRTLTVDTTGDVTVASIQDTSGGVDPDPGQPHIHRIRVFSLADLSDLLGVESTYKGETRTTYLEGLSSAMPLTVLTFRNKIYAPTGNLVYFSGVVFDLNDVPEPDPTVWINDPDGTPKKEFAGFINLGTQASRTSEVIGMGIYQSRLAFFTEDLISIWNIDIDPNNNTPYQTLLNVGAVATDGIIEFGDLDVFFLSDSGVRSLRARDSSNLASASDVGVPIDKQLVDFVRANRVAAINAKAVIEPEDSRYLLAIGNQVFVYSNFPGSNVRSWSTYELDSEVQEWAIASGRLYARLKGDDDQDWLVEYGGATGDVYGEYETEVQTPFLSANNPATRKLFKSLDVGCDGIWELDYCIEPTDVEWSLSDNLVDNTFGSVGAINITGDSTHIAMRLRTSEAQAARLGSLIIHFDEIEAR